MRLVISIIALILCIPAIILLIDLKKYEEKIIRKELEWDESYTKPRLLITVFLVITSGILSFIGTLLSL